MKFIKHYLSFFLLIILLNTSAYSQKKKFYFEHGNLLLIGSVYPTEIVHGLSFDKYRDNEEILFEANQQIHYFITSKIAFGISARCALFNNYDYSNRWDTIKTKKLQYFIGPSIKVYPIGNRCKLITELTYYRSNTSYFKGPDEYYSKPVVKYLELGAGFNLSFSKHIGMEYKCSILHALSKNKDYYYQLYNFNLCVSYRI